MLSGAGQLKRRPDGSTPCKRGMLPPMGKDVMSPRKRKRLIMDEDTDPEASAVEAANAIHEAVSPVRIDTFAEAQRRLQTCLTNLSSAIADESLVESQSSPDPVFILFCQRAAEAIDQASAVDNAKTSQLLRDTFGCEVTLASRLCDVLDANVRRQFQPSEGSQAPSQEGPQAIVNVLRTLLQLSTSQIPAAKPRDFEGVTSSDEAEPEQLSRLLRRRMIGCLLDVQAVGPEGSPCVFPVFDLLTSRGVVLAAPGSMAKVIKGRLEAQLFGDGISTSTSSSAGRRGRIVKCSQPPATKNWLWYAGCLVEELLGQVENQLPEHVLVEVKRVQEMAYAEIVRLGENDAEAAEAANGTGVAEIVRLGENDAEAADVEGGSDGVAATAVASPKASPSRPKSKAKGKVSRDAKRHAVQAEPLASPRQDMPSGSPRLQPRRSPARTPRRSPRLRTDALHSGRVEDESAVTESHVEAAQSEDVIMELTSSAASNASVAIPPPAGASEENSKILFQLVVGDLMGGAAAFVQRAMQVLEAQVQALVVAGKELLDAESDEEEALADMNNPTAKIEEAVTGHKTKILGLLWMVDELLTMDEADSIPDELVQALVKNAMMVIDLPEELRPALLPIRNVLLRDCLVERTAAELWVQTEATSKSKFAPRTEWAYCLACLATEVLDVVNAKPTPPGELIKMQLSGVHVAMRAYVQTACARTLQAEIEAGVPRSRRKALTRGEEGGDSEDGKDDEVEDDEDDDDGEDSDYNDCGSDLADFIDTSEEHNHSGLLQSLVSPEFIAAAAAAAPLGNGSADDHPEGHDDDGTELPMMPPAVQVHCATGVIPEWQDHCRMMLVCSPPPPEVEEYLLPVESTT